MSVANTHPGDSTERGHQVDEPCEHCKHHEHAALGLRRANAPLALDDDTLRKTSPQNIVAIIRAGYGTPKRLTRAKMLGAFPSAARPYSVRDAIYRSEFAALSTKSKMQALMT